MKFLINSICIILLLVAISGCKKHCRYGKLPKMNGGDGFSELTSAIIYEKGYMMGGRKDLDIIITNTTNYDSLLYSKRPCGNVDFNDKIIAASCRHVNPNDGIKINSKVYINTVTPTIKFRADYSLHNQCNGSGIQSYEVTFLAILLKAFSSHQIIYDIRDVNPF